MTSTIKRLGATTVVADTNTDLYTVPASTSTVVSTIQVCNIGTSERTFRIAIRDGAISNEDYLFYDVTIGANDSFAATAGYTMATTNVITVRANHADVVFSAFGTEVTQ